MTEQQWKKANELNKAICTLKRELETLKSNKMLLEDYIHDGELLSVTASKDEHRTFKFSLSKEVLLQIMEIDYHSILEKYSALRCEFDNL